MTRYMTKMACVLAVVALTACGTKPAPDFRGRWKPINTVDESPRPIPLQPVQRFVVSPADRSLKHVVQRWAEASGRRAAYRAPTDFSIHLDATKVSAATIETAVAQLSSAYAAEGIRVELQPALIVVTGGSARGTTAASADAGGSH